MPLEIRTSALLSQVPRLAHGFCTRRGGVSTGRFAQSNFSPRPYGELSNVLGHLKMLVAQLPEPTSRIVQLQQVHSDRIVSVSSRDLDRQITLFGERADGMICAEPSVCLCVFTADCVPVLLADRAGTAIAAVHAGWKGTAAGIHRRAVQMFAKNYCIPPSQLVVALGPAIAGTCYQVREDCIAHFNRHKGCYQAKDGAYLLDLRAVLKEELQEEGLSPAMIEVLPDCTHCDKDRYYSYRRDGSPVGCHASFLMLAREVENA